MPTSDHYHCQTGNILNRQEKIRAHITLFQNSTKSHHLKLSTRTQPMLSQPTSTKNTKPYSFLTRTKPFCTHMRSPSPDYLWHSWHLTPPCVAGQNLPLKSATCTITSLAVQTSHMNFCSGSRRKKNGIHILWKEWVPGLRGKEDHGIMTQCFWKIMYYFQQFLSGGNQARL